MPDVTAIYEDADSLAWAKETCEQMFRGDGKEGFRGTWWKLDELSEPAVLAGAVSKAMRADLIVVATQATAGFPLPFYVWVRSWLPHRLRGEGQFVALVTSPPRSGLNVNCAAEYLRAVAQQARMHFQISERDPAWSTSLNIHALPPRRRLNGVLALNRKAKNLNGHGVTEWRMAA